MGQGRNIADHYTWPDHTSLAYCHLIPRSSSTWFPLPLSPKILNFLEEQFQKQWHAILFSGFTFYFLPIFQQVQGGTELTFSLGHCVQTYTSASTVGGKNVAPRDHPKITGSSHPVLVPSLSPDENILITGVCNAGVRKHPSLRGCDNHVRTAAVSLLWTE